MKKLLAFNGVKIVEPPKTLKATLRDYQTEGLSWMQFLREYHLAGGDLCPISLDRDNLTGIFIRHFSNNFTVCGCLFSHIQASLHLRDSKIFTEGEAITTVPVFNLEQWGIVLPVFVISLLIGLIDEILRLIIGVYCKLVMISNILCGVIQIVLSAIVLKVLPIWNPNFVLEIEQALGANADSSANFFTYWNADMVSNGLLAFIVVITLFEIGVTIYKTLRYGVSVKNGINSNT